VAQHLGDPLAGLSAVGVGLGALGVDRGLHALAQVIGQWARAGRRRGRARTGLGGAALALRQRAAFITHTVPPAARTAGGMRTAQYSAAYNEPFIQAR
jgi:hypothetical protein